ncbi:MAG: hypothetical protein WCI39_02710 [Gallionellaceae bacterium]
MKKIVLSLVATLAVTAFAPEASAVPVFARQTGMACSACHFQHFPLLNGFGRAFKSAGFTMMGAQGKIEGEGLSMPEFLNMGVLSSAYWQDEKGATSGANGKGQARYGVPASGGELSLFYGGRLAEFGGFLSELGAAGTAGAAATGAAKLVLLFPVGEARAGLVAYTGGQGAAYGFETLNTGAADTHKMMGNSGPNKQHVAATYAGSYLGTRTDATGINLVANNDMGFVSFGKFGAVGPGTGSANDLPLTYVRAVMNMELAGWDSAVGVQRFSGDQSILTTTNDRSSYEATVIDFQMQGQLGTMPTGLYVTYGTAPANVNSNKMAGGWSNLVKTNGVSQVDLAATSLNVATSIEVAHATSVQAAVRFATLKYGSAAASVSDQGKSYADNAIMLGATYDLAQNVALGLNYTMQSGSAYDAYKTANGKEAVGITSTTLLLEALF